MVAFAYIISDLVALEIICSRVEPEFAQGRCVISVHFAIAVYSFELLDVHSRARLQWAHTANADET